MASKPKTTSRSKASNTDTKLVRELAGILNETELTEIEYEKGTLKIRVSKGGGQMVQMATAAPAALAAPAAVAPVSAATPVDNAAEPAPAEHPGAVKSPMVGTVYVRPSPDAEPFVNIGDKVKEGDTIMLVEAMKTFNPIVAPKSGIIEAVMVQDAQPVEFGEALFVLV